MDEPESPGRRAAGHGGTERAGSGSAGTGHDEAGHDEAGHDETGHGQARYDQEEVVEFAEHAEFAEFAEHAEFAEFAEHEALAGHTEHDASADQHEHAHGHRHPDGQPDVYWRNEMMHLVRAANRLQSAGTLRLHRPDRPEPRWPVTVSVIIAIVLERLLPAQLALHPIYLLPALEGALLVGLSVANPVRIEKRSRPIRTASVTLILLITAANAVSAVLLVNAIITNVLFIRESNGPIHLLGAGAAIWGTNVIAFALWYWEFDRGGPVNRLEGTSPYPDLMFPQMTAPELTPQGWGPRFVDYLYLSFTNATAFSPTDVMPLARWAKMTMLVQSAVSLALGALVIARAINIL